MELLEAAKAVLGNARPSLVAGCYMVPIAEVIALDKAVKALEPPEVVLQGRFQVLVGYGMSESVLCYEDTYDEAMRQGKKALSNGYSSFRVQPYYKKAD